MPNPVSCVPSTHYLVVTPEITGGLQRDAEVKSILRFEMSDLNYTNYGPLTSVRENGNRNPSSFHQ